MSLRRRSTRRRLTEHEHIVFDGNTHDEAICMRYQDHADLEHPRVAVLSS